MGYRGLALRGAEQRAGLVHREQGRALCHVLQALTVPHVPGKQDYGVANIPALRGDQAMWNHVTCDRTVASAAPRPH